MKLSSKISVRKPRPSGWHLRCDTPLPVLSRRASSPPPAGAAPSLRTSSSVHAPVASSSLDPAAAAAGGENEHRQLGVHIGLVCLALAWAPTSQAGGHYGFKAGMHTGSSYSVCLKCLNPLDTSEKLLYSTTPLSCISPSNTVREEWPHTLVAFL